MQHKDYSSLLNTLDDLSLDSTVTIEHEKAFTVDEQSQYVLPKLPTGSVLTKNLFVRDKKYGHFLITAKSDREVNMKQVASMLNLSGANLRFVDEAMLLEKLGVIRGAVSPFALINDTELSVKFCIDKALTEINTVNIHPLVNDRTTSISFTDLKLFLNHIKHEPIVLDFDSAPMPLPPAAPKEKKNEKPPAKEKKAKGETLLGLSVKKDENFAQWYTDTVTLSELIDYSDVSGCYVLRPWSYAIWEVIQNWFDSEIKKLGVKNAYFPVFVSERALNSEKDHIEGFKTEVAWVTRSGDTDLKEPIAIRPTSETIMYPFFAKWIRSHRDLPLELNQWCSVVRWEFKDPTPFLRSREFLWQEGHTAHSSYEEAQERMFSILDLYAKVYEELLAVPVIKGMKTEEEKFPGGEHTTTCEAYISGSGRAIQGATSHNLGQNFGKMFNIVYEDEKKEKKMPWQTSWGLTTRSIGVSIMVHGDDKGLVLPPRVAPKQAVIIPIVGKDTNQGDLSDYTNSLYKKLKVKGIRVELDDRANYTPGWKYNHWEQKGVPVRIEVGLRDMKSKQCRIVRRDNGEKIDRPVEDLDDYLEKLMETIQSDMFNKAKAARDEKLVQVKEWKDFVPALNDKCLVMTPFCDEGEWEEKVKKLSRAEALQGEEEAATTSTSVAAKTLCKPFEQPPLPEGTTCFISGKPAKTWVIWGRSY